MPVKLKRKSAVAKAAPRSAKPEAPLGVMKARVLKTLDLLKHDAFGYEVVKVLFANSKEWIDPSQVYQIMRELRTAGLIEPAGVRPPSGRGPSMKIFRLTAAGRAALASSGEYYRAVGEYLLAD